MAERIRVGLPQSLALPLVRPGLGNSACQPWRGTGGLAADQQGLAWPGAAGLARRGLPARQALPGPRRLPGRALRPPARATPGLPGTEGFYLSEIHGFARSGPPGSARDQDVIVGTVDIRAGLAWGSAVREAARHIWGIEDGGSSGPGSRRPRPRRNTRKGSARGGPRGRYPWPSWDIPTAFMTVFSI